MKGEQLTSTDAVMSFSRRKKISRAAGTLGEIEKVVDWGALLKKGTIVDATIIPSGNQPLRYMTCVRWRPS